MFCGSCGNFIDDDSKFCSICGKAVQMKKTKKHVKAISLRTHLEKEEKIGGIYISTYKAFLGKHEQYYLQKFRRIEKGMGGKACPAGAWLAFLLWFIYKGMIGQFWIYLLSQGSLTALQLYCLVVGMAEFYLTGTIGKFWGVFIIVLIKFFIWLYYVVNGGQCYYNHVRKKICDMGMEKVSAEDDEAARYSLASMGEDNMVGVVLVIMLMFALIIYAQKIVGGNL